MLFEPFLRFRTGHKARAGANPHYGTGPTTEWDAGQIKLIRSWLDASATKQLPRSEAKWAPDTGCK